ncbi:MAG: hypothetical protein AAGB04_12295, partial [Pseudomonadota bacterium]
QKGPSSGYQKSALAAMIRSSPSGQATILVTHSSNIRAVTGVKPASGETLLVNRRGRVVGRIAPR